MSNISWNKETKQYWIKVMKEHRDADRLIRGCWLEDEVSDSTIKRGCFFGCAMQTDDDALAKAIRAMSLPSWLIYLAEKIYESLPGDEYLDFPVQLLEVIPVDADLTQVECKVNIARLTALSEKNPSVSDAINVVIKCWWALLDGDNVDTVNWSAARSAAESATRLAAEPAARSAARSAAWSATWSADSAARSAARSVDSAAWSAAWSADSAARSADSAAWSAERDNLINFLGEIK